MVNTIQATPHNISWADIPRAEHIVHIYPSNEAFLDALEGFVAAGVDQNEAVVVIVTPEQLQALGERLRKRSMDIDALQAGKALIAMDADESLGKFMIRDWPDEALFLHFVHRILVRTGNRRVRAFSELVALLWARGHREAMLRLEGLWHRACASTELTLLCAYPRDAFPEDRKSTIKDIQAAHSFVLD
jgi:hypothetical protein